MITQQCDVLVLTHKERMNRFKDQVIRNRYDQADLVLEANEVGHVVVVKDQFGLLRR